MYVLSPILLLVEFLLTDNYNWKYPEDGTDVV